MCATKVESDVAEAASGMAEKGFFVFRDILSQDEIADLRSAIRQHFKTAGRPDPWGGLRQANSAIEIPAIAWVFHHPKILACLREAFGTNRIMFTSDATVYKDVLIGWHKDDIGVL